MWKCPKCGSKGLIAFKDNDNNIKWLCAGAVCNREYTEWEIRALSDDPTDEIAYYGSETDEDKCTCDFITQVLPYGCKCGGK